MRGLSGALATLLVCGCGGGDDAGLREARERSAKLRADYERCVGGGTCTELALRQKQEHDARVAADAKVAAQRAADAARPPMGAPAVLPKELLRKPRAQVTALLGKLAREGESDVVAKDGTRYVVDYAKSVVTSVVIEPANFGPTRDASELRRVLGFPADRDEASYGKIPVGIVMSDRGAAVRDRTDDVAKEKAEDAQLDSDRRKTFAEFLEGTMRRDGQAVSIAAKGKANAILRIRWDGCSEPELETFVNANPLFEHNKYGFTRVDCDRGDQTWTVTYGK